MAGRSRQSKVMVEGARRLLHPRLQGVRMQHRHPAPKAMAILFDSSMSLLPSQFGDALKDRHLVFAGQDFDMHLKISGTDGNNELHGQVIPHRPRNNAPQSSTITLLAHGTP